MIHLKTTLPLEQAVERINRSVLGSGASVSCVDNHCWSGPEGSVATLVYDKYYMRNSSRASLTVTVTDITGGTEVRAVGSGGSTGALLNFDWGASGDFEDAVRSALRGTIGR